MASEILNAGLSLKVSMFKMENLFCPNGIAANYVHIIIQNYLQHVVKLLLAICRPFFNLYFDRWIRLLGIHVHFKVLKTYILSFKPSNPKGLLGKMSDGPFAK